MQRFFFVLSPKIRFLLALGGMILAVALLIWFAFFFLFDRVRSSSAEIEAAKIRRASIEVRRGEAKQEEAAFSELRDDAGRVEGTFIESPLALFEFLEDLAGRNNLSIALALEGQVGSGGRPERLRVSVDGTYRNLLRFVRGIESAPYATEIRAVALSMVNQQPALLDSLARLSIDLRILIP